MAVAGFEVLLDDFVRAVAGDWLEAELSSAAVGAASTIPAPDAQAILASPEGRRIISTALDLHARNYGQPTSLLLTDAWLPGFADHFRSAHDETLAIIKEVNARRNLLLHSDGKVDQDYLTDTGSSLRSGTRLNVDQEYLAQALRALRAIGTCLAGSTAQLYGGTIAGKFGRAHASVHRI